MIRISTVLVLVIFMCSTIQTVSVCWAEPVAVLKERARRLYFGDGEPRDFNTALNLYLQAAEQGDAEAQYIAGGMYFKGRGTPVDYEKAFALLYKAAKNGKSTPESQKIIAQSFLLGQSVPKNFDEAVRWYTKAAESGDSDAQNELAFMFFTGNGIEKDYSKAHDLFLDAAKQNHSLAQYNLGIMYYSGEGVPEIDLISAYAWFSIAATNGHQQASQGMDFLETVLTASEVQKAQKMAESLYKSIKSGK